MGWGRAHTAPPAAVSDLERIVTVEFLNRVDGIASLVAYRGLDDESREDLKRLSLEARRLVGEARALGRHP